MRTLSLLTLIACLGATGCASTPAPFVDTSAFDTACGEQRPQMCTREYRPVCGLRDTGVRCVTTPCDSAEWTTYGNGCTACSDPEVYGYNAGECPEGDDDRP